jgi:hypothetical protein
MIFSCNENIKLPCEKITEISSIEICSPLYKSYSEMSGKSVIKRHINTTTPRNLNIVAFYIKNKDTFNLNKNFNVPFDDYFTINVPDEWIDLEINRAQLKSLIGAIDDSYLKSNWEEIIKKSSIKNHFIPDVPTIVSKKKINPDIYNTITLTKLGNEKTPILMSISVVLIKNRIFALSYFLEYKETNSVKYSQEKSIKFALDFYTLNK